MERIICPNCKAEITDGSKTCPKCGAVLPSAGVSVSLTNSYSGRGENPNQVNQQHVAQAILNENKTQINPKTARNVGIIFVLLVIVLILIIVISSSVGSSNENGDSGAGTEVLSSASSEDSQSSTESSAESSASSDAAVASSPESSTEESSEPSSEVSDTRTITAEKPDAWSDIYCYAYTLNEEKNEKDKNATFPGEAMTESDGKYTYQIPESFGDEECYLIFSTTSVLQEGFSKQYPYMNEDGFAVSEKSDFTLSDFTEYAAEYEDSKKAS